MLSIEQIVTLSEKGFSFDQIGTLNEVLSDSAKQQEPEQNQEPEQEQKKEPEQEQKKEPEPKNGNRKIEYKITDVLEKRINDLESTIKALPDTNAKTAAHEPEKKITAEDVIKSLMGAS